MKVLIVNKHISESLGGSEMQCDLIAKGLTLLGHEIVYAAVTTKTKITAQAPYTLTPLNFDDKNAFAKILERHKPDAIYWRYNKNSLKLVTDTAFKYKTPFIFAVSHILDVKRFGFKYKKRKFFAFALTGLLKDIILSAWNYEGFKKVSALTSLNSQFLDMAPVKFKRTIWNAVDKTIIPFSHEKNYCVWVSNIKSAKRPEIFIKLANELAGKYPDIDFLMVGQKQSKAYDDLLEQAQTTSNFHYLGPKSPQEVNGIVQSAICLIHTCKPEGFGNNFIQAWLQSCPTISFEFDPDNLIRNENLGFVSEGNFEKLSKDTQTLITDASLRNTIGERARLFAEKNFTPERMVKDVETFLLETLYNSKKQSAGRS